VLGASVRRHYSVGAFAIGAVIGGLVSASALLIAGSVFRLVLPEPIRWGLLFALLSLFVARQFGAVRFPVPENRRLVPETVFRLGYFFGPLQFGIEMGTGARTYVTSNVPYMLAVMVLLTADVGAGLASGAGFGVGRALMAWGSTQQRDTGEWHAKWSRSSTMLSAMLLAVFLVLAVLVSFVHLAG
jgi:hypothetical protein